MPIEKRTGLFYELMIRGNHDPAGGRPLGEVMTYQLQTGSAIIDTDTNTLAAPYAPDPAVDVTKDQAVALLGEQFATFAAQLTDTQKQLADTIAAARAAADAAAKEIADRDASLATAAAAIADRDAQIATLMAAHGDLSSRIGAATAALQTPAAKA